MLTLASIISLKEAAGDRDLHSFPTRRSSDLGRGGARGHGPLGASAAAPEARGGARPRAEGPRAPSGPRSEEHTSELQSPYDLVCRLLLEKKKKLLLVRLDILTLGRLSYLTKS